MGSLETDYAWAAGFFDGEGHVTCRLYKGKVRATHAQMLMCIGQADRRVLDRFHKIFQGVGTINGPYKNKGKGCYRWVTTGETVEAIFTLMWPYLDEVKKLQYKVAAEKHEEFCRNKRRVA